ncbi:ubiquitin-2 like Rad60 SUMO-like-domain-containing protein [Scenedesmus sp. NREL 46B-D3]|nr:ubiquitin-2 like Rad60 SUMO-like-domain-containing protein [Scenedesmus sp. NREL 46B-D3]
MSNEGTGEDLQIRFRHSSGTDIGPFSFEDGNTIQSVKSVVFGRWPTDGPLVKECPSSAADLRLLCSGQFLDNSKTLKDYRKLMGSTEPLAVVTMHVLVRPPQAGKAADKADADPGKPAKSGCGCVIC